MPDQAYHLGAAAVAGRQRLLSLAGIFVLGSIVAVELGFRLAVALPPHGDISGWLLHPGRALNDSWDPMIMAYHWLRGTHQGTIYQQIFFAEHVKFQYPPTALLPVAAIDFLGIAPSAELLNVIGRLSVVLIAAANAALAVALAARTGIAPAGAMGRLALMAAVTGLATVMFYPVMRAYNIGQIQTLIDAAFALACLCWLLGQRFGTGVLIGAICLLKPQLGLFLMWGALRRQWPFLAGWCVVVGPGLAISIGLFGIDNHLDYLSVLQYLSRHGEAFHGNQSVNGFLNRWFFPNLSEPFSFHSFPPYQSFVYLGTLVSSAVLILASLFLRARQPDRSGMFDFLAAALTFTIASPIAWEHHYGILPPIFVTLLFGVLALPPSAARWGVLAVLAASYLLSATYVSFAGIVQGAWLDLFDSYLLLAGLATLWLLYRVPTPPGFDQVKEGITRTLAPAVGRA